MYYFLQQELPIVCYKGFNLNIMHLTITQIDTACMLIDINGYRNLTDPAFDEAGGEYVSPATGRILKKLKSPARPASPGRWAKINTSRSRRRKPSGSPGSSG